MRVRYVRVQSYRGLDDVKFVVGENATLVGKNDAGKSSILQALGWFFWRGETGPPEDTYRWHMVDDIDFDAPDQDSFPDDLPETFDSDRQIAESIRVTVGFGDLAPADHQRLQQLLGSDAEYLHEVREAEVGQPLLRFQRRFGGRVRRRGDPFNPEERVSTLWLQANWPRGIPPEVLSWHDHDESAKGTADVHAAAALAGGIQQQYEKLLQSIDRYGDSETGPDPTESLLSGPYAGPFLRSLSNRRGKAGDTGPAAGETGETPSLQGLDEPPLTRGPWFRCDLSVLDVLPEFVHLVARVQDYRAWLSRAVTPLLRRTLRRELAAAGIPLGALLAWLDVFHERFSYEARQALSSTAREFAQEEISLLVRSPGQSHSGVLGSAAEVDVPSSLGDGSQRRLLLSVLKLYENRELWAADDALVLAIEEPELFLHPEAQRELVVSITGLRRHGIQAIVSTHSATMVDRADLGDVLVVRAAPDEHGDKHRSVSSLRFHSDQFREILDELGHRPSDLLYAACIVLVEGPSDQKILEAWSHTLLDHDLQELGIRVVSSRGNAAMSFYVDAVLFREAGVPCVAVVDGDKGKPETEQRIQKLRDAGLQENRELFAWNNCIESFLDRSALEQALQLKPDSISPIDFSRQPIENIEHALQRAGRSPIRRDARGRPFWYDKMEGAKAARLMSRRQIHERVEQVIVQIVHHARGGAEASN